MESIQAECKQCGTCCANGGPALHLDDRELIMAGTIPLAHLITIRKGELVHHPVSGSIQSVGSELIKISGAGKTWSCFYFDTGEKGCTIYDSRPRACRELECWNTGAIEKMIEKDLLSRQDLIAPDDPLFKSVLEHERNFPCPDLGALLENGSAEDWAPMEEHSNNEVAFRSEQVSHHELSLGEELFYFGRPLFHLLISIGAVVRESGGRLIVARPQK